MSEVQHQLERSHDRPDRWLRCVEGDAGKLTEGLKPPTSLRFGTAKVLPDGPRTPYVEHVPHTGRA